MERITRKHAGRTVRLAEVGVEEHTIAVDIIQVRDGVVHALFELRGCRIEPTIWRVVEVLADGEEA